MSARDLIFHELIGLKIEVVYSPNICELGIRGKVVDETRNLLIVRSNSSLRRIEKRYRVFKFVLPCGKRAYVCGSSIVGRPEERVKRV